LETKLKEREGREKNITMKREPFWGKRKRQGKVNRKELRKSWGVRAWPREAQAEVERVVGGRKSCLFPRKGELKGKVCGGVDADFLVQ